MAVPERVIWLCCCGAWRDDVCRTVRRITWPVNGEEQPQIYCSRTTASLVPSVLFSPFTARLVYMEKSSFHAQSSLRKPEVSTVFSQVSNRLRLCVLSATVAHSLYSLIKMWIIWFKTGMSFCSKDCVWTKQQGQLSVLRVLTECVLSVISPFFFVFLFSGGEAFVVAMVSGLVAMGVFFCLHMQRQSTFYYIFLRFICLLLYIAFIWIFSTV